MQVDWIGENKWKHSISDVGVTPFSEKRPLFYAAHKAKINGYDDLENWCSIHDGTSKQFIETIHEFAYPV
jgi:hypothetical protein